MATNPVQLDFSKAVPINQPAQPQSDSGSGVTLDFSKAQPISAQPTATTPTPAPAQPSSPQSEEIQINPGDSLLTKAAKTVGGLFQGVGEGVFGTAAGASDLIDKATGMQPGGVNRYLHTLSGDNYQTHGAAQNVGRVGEDVAEFILGDEALKGLSVSEKLAQATKAAKVIEDSPLLSRVVQVGVRALRGATVAGTQGAVKSGGDTGTALASGVAGGVGNAVVPEVGDALQAAKNALPGALDTIKTVIKPGLIQDAFQGQIRDIINSAAKDAGVDTSNASSIRDVAQDVSNALQSRAKAAYQALDDATGGRVQRFSDAIKAVQQKLRNLNGIQTPDDEGAWIEKLNDLQDAHEKAMQEAEAAGVPRSLLDKANADYKASKSMLDLSKNIRASAEGLRPELASGAKKPIPETVNTGKLFSRVQKMYDSGRLQDALGNRAAELVQAVNDSHAVNQLAQSWRGIMKKYTGYAAIGALPFGGYEAVRHFLGE